MCVRVSCLSTRCSTPPPWGRSDKLLSKNRETLLGALTPSPPPLRIVTATPPVPRRQQHHFYLRLWTNIFLPWKAWQWVAPIMSFHLLQADSWREQMNVKPPAFVRISFEILTSCHVICDWKRREVSCQGCALGEWVTFAPRGRIGFAVEEIILSFFWQILFKVSNAAGLWGGLGQNILGVVAVVC